MDAQSDLSLLYICASSRFYSALISLSLLLIERPHDKTNKMTCAPNEDLYQPGHLPVHPANILSWRFGS